MTMNKLLQLTALILLIVFFTFCASGCLGKEEKSETVTQTESFTDKTDVEQTEKAGEEASPSEEPEESFETEVFTGFAFEPETTDENATETRAPRIPENPRMTLSPIELSLYIGDKASISAFTNFDTDGFSWNSDDSGVCSVDKSGNIKAKAKGQAVITCKAMCGEKEASATCKITVVPKTITVKLDPCSGTVSKKSIKAKEGEPVGKLPTPQREGFEFLGWYTKAQDGKKVTSKSSFSSDTTVYAVWKEEKYPVITNYTYYQY